MTLLQKIRVRLAHSARDAGDHDATALADLAHEASPDPSLTAAAVLIPIVDHGEGMSILLTQRTKHLHAHAGQISFPGGQREACDRNSVDTALRETEEEIGITPEHIDIIGQLRDFDTVTGFRITPVVGIIKPGFTLNLDSFEVAEVFEIPLLHALDPANYRHRTTMHNGVEHRYCILDHEERYIWGATAAILQNLSDRLGRLVP